MITQISNVIIRIIVNRIYTKYHTSRIILAASFAAGRAFFIAHPTPAAARNSLSFSPSIKAINYENNHRKFTFQVSLSRNEKKGIFRNISQLPPNATDSAIGILKCSHSSFKAEPLSVPKSTIRYHIQVSII